MNNEIVTKCTIRKIFVFRNIIAKVIKRRMSTSRIVSLLDVLEEERDINLTIINALKNIRNFKFDYEITYVNFYINDVLCGQDIANIQRTITRHEQLYHELIENIALVNRCIKDNKQNILNCLYDRLMHKHCKIQVLL